MVKREFLELLFFLPQKHRNIEFHRELVSLIEKENTMNKVLLLFFILFILKIDLSIGQPITDTITFDHYSSASANDFTDHFTMGNGLIQIQD